MGAAGAGGSELGGSGAKSQEQGCASVAARSAGRTWPETAGSCIRGIPVSCVSFSLSIFIFLFLEEVQISGVVGD